MTGERGNNDPFTVIPARANIAKLARGAGLVGVTLVAGMAAEGLLPITASAQSPDCTSTEQTSPDQGTTTIDDSCTYDSTKTVTEQYPSPDQTAATPNSDSGFFGYNMARSSLTDGNGCFLTETSSVIRRATHDPSVTPYHVYTHSPALQKRWSPSKGVKEGLLFSILPTIVKPYGLHVKEADYRQAWKAVRAGEQAMVLFGKGYFTGIGHYAGVYKGLDNGRVVLEDPNGKGKHGDSERASGWSGKELHNLGALTYRIIY